MKWTLCADCKALDERQRRAFKKSKKQQAAEEARAEVRRCRRCGTLAVHEQ